MPQFPHRGYPIAPPTLRPILGVALPTYLTSFVQVFSSLADLDERIWSYVDNRIAERLGNLVVARAEKMRASDFWQTTCFPSLTCPIDLRDLKLEEHTAVYLTPMFRKELGGNAAGLAQYSLDNLAARFGVRAIIDLLAAVNFHIKTEQPRTQPHERLTKDDIDALLKTPTKWRAYGYKRLPITAGPQSVDDLPLCVRTHKCLRRLITEGAIRTGTDLSQLTLFDLMSCGNFGVKSLWDLLDVISPLVIDATPPADHSPSSDCIDAAQPSSDRKCLSRGTVQQIIEAPTLWRQFLAFHLPPLSATVDLPAMRLRARTHNCVEALLKNKVISRPSDLDQLTVGQIMKTKNFGLTSLVDLLCAIERNGLYSFSPPPPISSSRELHVRDLSIRLTETVHKLTASRLGHRVRCDDPRLHEPLGELLYFANNASDNPPLEGKSTLHEVARRLLTRTRDPLPADGIVDLITRIRSTLAALARGMLQYELRSLASQHVMGRNIEVVVRFLGWEGEPPRTLQSVGDDFGITRERVRQVVTKFAMRSRRAKAFLPALEKVSRYISRRVPRLADEIEKELTARGLTTTKFRIESVVHTAHWLGMPVQFAIDESHGVRLVVPAQSAGLARLISSHTRRLVSKFGLVNLADLQETLSDATRSSFDSQILGKAVSNLPFFEDLGCGWFWLKDARRNHLLTIIRKVLAVAPRIHVGEMRAAIANDPRGMGFAPPKGVILAFCHSAAACDVEDDFISSRDALGSDQVLSEVERVIVDVFRMYGPLLSRAEFEQRCVERGVNHSTTTLYVSRLAIVAKYGVGVYGLRGAHFTPGDLERVSRRPRNYFSDHGWTENAKPWVALEISASIIASGVVQLPVGIRHHLVGHYVLKAEGGEAVGQLVVSERATWGLGPLFRRRGGESGDILLLIFDLQLHEAMARLGDLTVLPDPQNLTEEVTEC